MVSLTKMIFESLRKTREKPNSNPPTGEMTEINGSDVLSKALSDKNTSELLKLIEEGVDFKERLGDIVEHCLKTSMGPVQERTLMALVERVDAEGADVMWNMSSFMKTEAVKVMDGLAERGFLPNGSMVLFLPQRIVSLRHDHPESLRNLSALLQENGVAFDRMWDRALETWLAEGRAILTARRESEEFDLLTQRGKKKKRSPRL